MIKRNKKGQFLKGSIPIAGFKKGIIPWSKSQKGIHLSPKSEFKKGNTPWNKGLRDEQTNGWKGSEVGYDGVHDWVERHLGKPKKCAFCGTTKEKVYQWSNKDHKYKRRLSDYQRLCVKCHHRYDYENFGARKAFYK